MDLLYLKYGKNQITRLNADNEKDFKITNKINNNSDNENHKENDIFKKNNIIENPNKEENLFSKILKLYAINIFNLFNEEKLKSLESKLLELIKNDINNKNRKINLNLALVKKIFLKIKKKFCISDKSKDFDSINNNSDNMQEDESEKIHQMISDQNISISKSNQNVIIEKSIPDFEEDKCQEKIYQNLSKLII